MYVTFQTAEVAVPRELFAAILERIGWLGVPPPWVERGWRCERTKARQRTELAWMLRGNELGPGVERWLEQDRHVGAARQVQITVSKAALA